MGPRLSPKPQQKEKNSTREFLCIEFKNFHSMQYRSQALSDCQEPRYAAVRIYRSGMAECWFCSVLRQLTCSVICLLSPSNSPGAALSKNARYTYVIGVEICKTSIYQTHQREKAPLRKFHATVRSDCSLNPGSSSHYFLRHHPGISIHGGPTSLYPRQWGLGILGFGFGAGTWRADCTSHLSRSKVNTEENASSSLH